MSERLGPTRYLPGVDVEADAAFICTIPMPRPPMAPASSPNKISTGKLSISDLFFTGFPSSLKVLSPPV